MTDVGELKAKFLHAYANLPEPERPQVVIIVEEKPYSWDAAYNEILADTALGNKILTKLNLLGIL